MKRFLINLLILGLAASGLGGCDLLTSPETRVERAGRQIAEGEYRQAVFELRKALEDEPGHVQARLLLAQAEFGSGEVTAAEADLDRAIEAGADPAATALLKARIQLVLGRPQILLTQLDAGEIVLPEPERSLFRGRALMAMRQPAEAMRAFEAALRTRAGGDGNATRHGGRQGRQRRRQRRARGSRGTRQGRNRPRLKPGWRAACCCCSRAGLRMASRRWARPCSMRRGD